MSEPITLPSEADQQARWGRDLCVLCAEPMPPEASYAAQYCSPSCRKAMTKARRQQAARDRQARKHAVR